MLLKLYRMPLQSVVNTHTHTHTICSFDVTGTALTKTRFRVS